MTAVMGCGGSERGSSQGLQVDAVEEGRARVVELGSGKARTVDLSTLPAGAREGDVVVDGRLDPELRARLTREVAEIRGRLAVPLPPGLDLGGSEDPPLTIPREK
ncbi:DUF3006 domain-containing protein [Hyalangium versicolor]|uniref:DUF3006 domain-containing protein n=1 Tax=Hyalangium versicolor TaxID=2861190 RepID=UPI001CC98BA7|nr:DUF3006 domain-containing protein [Hyalangium versicolor]